MIVIYFKLSY